MRLSSSSMWPGGLLARLHAGDEAAVALHVVGQLVGVHRDGGVEVGEGHHHEEQGKVVAEALVAGEMPSNHWGGFPRTPACATYMGMSTMAWAKMIGITPAAFTFKRDVVAHPTVLLVALHALGELHRDAAGALHQQDEAAMISSQITTSRRITTRPPPPVVRPTTSWSEALRQLCQDADHDDQRDAVAQAALGDALTEPHHEEGAGR
jgi:hypothetical protein